MTTVNLLNGARIAVPDLYARLEHVENMIETYVRDMTDIPETVNFKSVMMIARMAANNNLPVRASDLKRLGYYMGSNVSYNLSHMIEAGYIVSKPGSDKRTRWLELTVPGRQLGTDVAMHLNFIETQIGPLFARESHTKMVDFLANTVHGDEQPRVASRAREDA